MLHIVYRLPVMRELTRLLDGGRSVWLLAPKYYGKRYVFRRLATEYATRAGLTSVSLSSEGVPPTGRLDYSTLWSIVQRQIGVKLRVRSTSAGEFERSLSSGLAKCGRQVLFLVSGARSGNEDNHSELMAVFNRMLSGIAANHRDAIRVVATDDYSVFYDARRPTLQSELAYFDKLHYPHVSAADIRELWNGFALEHADAFTGVSADEAVAFVLDETGGHPGLVDECFQELVRCVETQSLSRWRSAARARLSSCDIVESIGRLLRDDPTGHAVTALEYEQESFPEASSPRVHVLRQLGVLQRVTPARVRLCKGVITTMVREMHQSSINDRTGRLGSLVCEQGPRVFEESQVELTDDDFVVIHLSDLHVSDRFRYRIAWQGQVMNEGEPSAAELLGRDIESMKLKGRVDAIVVTGDLVWSGAIEEFSRARDVLREIVAEVGISMDRVLVIPGNHDVQWKPGLMAASDTSRGVSCESFFLFLELIGKPTGPMQMALRIPSRSGRNVLRVIGLDSNHVEGPESAGIGFVSRDCLTHARELLETDRDSVDGESWTWLAVHHHVLPANSATVGDARRSNVSVMANSAEIQDCAVRWSVDAILHGHEHQPSVTVARKWPIDSSSRQFVGVTSIGAGSFGVKRDHLGPFSRNHYYVLCRRGRDLIIRSRCSGVSGVAMVGHEDLVLPR